MSLRLVLFAALFLTLLLTAPRVSASIQMPQNLSKEDRVKALQIVGLGTSSKVLTDPYPLGGYLGLEAGFALENLPAEDLGRLGRGLPAPQQDVTISKLSIGKGLYNNFDMFFQFTPYTRGDDIAQYGGIVRWGFYQAGFLPLSVGFLGHVNSANIGNQVTTHSYGFDFIGGVNVEHLALFAGIGLVEATGTFTGGASAITDSGQQETEFVSSVHTVIGADIRFQNTFIALQIDRYTLPVFSGKLGVRF